MAARRWLTRLLIGEIVLLCVLVTQQQFFWLFEAQRVYSSGDTTIYAIATYDWPLTASLLAGQVLLLVSLHIPWRSVRGIVSAGSVVVSLHFLLTMTRRAGTGATAFAEFLTISPPRDSRAEIYLPTEAWQESGFLSQLRLDPTFAIALALGVAALGLSLWAFFAAVRAQKVCPSRNAC